MIIIVDKIKKGIDICEKMGFKLDGSDDMDQFSSETLCKFSEITNFCNRLQEISRKGYSTMPTGLYNNFLEKDIHFEDIIKEMKEV